MDIQKIGIISLIKSAVTGQAVSLPANFDLELTWDMIKKHQITSMIYYGVSNCGLNMNPPIMKKLFSALCNCIIITEKQKIETDNVCKAFSENGIDHMLLKGAILREMYPQADMRLMGDVDIFIKTEQYDRIKKVMTQLGFIETTESDHEYIWKKNEIVIELHKRLIPSYNKDYYAYYGDGWKLAIPSGTMLHRYEMSAEDQMIYLFTHFAKHYRGGGIGLRHMTDLYVYRKSVGELDEEYLKEELQKLKIYEFYANIIKTIDVWFNDAAPDEKTDLITDAIFANGVYGLDFQRRIAETVILKKHKSPIKSERLQHIIRMIFPSLKNMRLKYSFLEKLPFLLPVAWLIRIFNIVFFKRKRAKKFWNDMKNISSENVSDYKRSLSYVGLDFNFEE